MRHTNVTLLMKANIHSLKLSKWVGHTDARLIDEVYAHVPRGDQKEITQTVERDLYSLGNNLKCYIGASSSSFILCPFCALLAFFN